ncbi:alpha/beta hydrolase family protein [Streptococcus sp. NLN76]|uniref:alpha/beta hydrolase-fold protein n=1 Tax=Streptococcus sp. NLN76 TaxID=2822800 RepID=UPI0018A9570E|nr:esterase family protein [Streptococcus sp. NLN76]
MALLHFQYKSEVLSMSVAVNLLYPDTALYNTEIEDIPALYLLHGMSGDENTWLRRTSIERYVRNTNLIVVFPDTHDGWYTNTPYGYDYFDAIALELPQVLAKLIPKMTRKREKTFVAGLSMGGYGAMKLALQTNRFSYAASLSGSLDFQDLESLVDDFRGRTYWQGVFGHQVFDQEHPANLLTWLEEADRKTKLFIWCGEQDFLFPANQRTKQILEKAGFDLRYSSSPGKHEWYYWDQQIQEVLKWLPIDYQEEERLS